MNALSSVTGLTAQAETQRAQAQQAEQQTKVQPNATPYAGPQDKITISSQAQQALTDKINPDAGNK